MRFTLLSIFLLWLSFNNVMAQNIQATPSKVLLFEKVYLHTDREVYIGGEDIWFSAYLVNALTNRFSNSSNTLYVELVSNQQPQLVVDKEIIHLDNGKGEGDFKLQDSLPAGTYHLRAWTNWMRNFGDLFLFSKDIKILKSLDVSPTKKETTVATKGQGNLGNPLQSNPTQGSLQFFPEGGSLVQNIASIIAFKALDAGGNDLGLNGEIVDQNGNTITSLESTNGMGVFSLQPLPGLIYTAKGNFTNGKSFNVTLPTALLKGYTMRVLDKDSVFNLLIGTNEQVIDSTKILTLIGKSKGKIDFNLQFPLKNTQSLVSIDKANLPEGITILTLYDYLGRPNCERLIYVAKQNGIILSIVPNKLVYQPKEKVSLTLKAVDRQNKPVKTTLSLAVVDANLVPLNTTDILSYLMLQSEIKGKIDHPNQYFNQTDPNRLRHLDLLLMTQGWRDFIWKQLADSSIRISNIPEKGITLTGTVKQSLTSKPIPNTNVTLFASGAKDDKLFSGRTDSTGSYYIDNVALYGPQTLKLTSSNDKGKKIGWLQMDSIFKYANYKNLAFTALEENPQTLSATATELLKRKINLKSKNSLKDTIQLNEVKVNASKGFNIAGEVGTEFGYKPEVFDVSSSDYDLSTLRRYILYKSKQAIERDEPESPGETRIVFPYGGKFLQPRIFVNGKELPFLETDSQDVKDTYHNIYYNLPMDKVEKVIIRHLTAASQLGFGEETGMSTVTGNRDFFVIYLTLKPNALEPAHANNIIEQVNGYYQARKFYQPSNLNSNNLTDQRTTVYWNPNVMTDENGQVTLVFFNSAIKTKVNVVAEGLSASGIPLVQKASYTVK